MSAKRHVLVETRFNTELWAKAMGDMLEIFERHDLASFLEVHETTIDHWSRADMAPAYPYPSMTNFIRICDTCDLNPSEFFVTQEVNP